MRTIVYQHTPKANKELAGWYWADAANHRIKHGPFESRAEARDAANAARITAEANAQSTVKESQR